MLTIARVENQISLCIPRVDYATTKTEIIKTFNKINIGKLVKVDLINKKSPKGEEEFKIAFLHFSEWNETKNGLHAKERLLSGKDIKVVYDFPWFWKVSMKKNERIV